MLVASLALVSSVESHARIVAPSSGNKAKLPAQLPNNSSEICPAFGVDPRPGLHTQTNGFYSSVSNLTCKTAQAQLRHSLYGGNKDMGVFYTCGNTPIAISFYKNATDADCGDSQELNQLILAVYDNPSCRVGYICESTNGGADGLGGSEEE